jgi:hypothetical protein
MNLNIWFLFFNALILSNKGIFSPLFFFDDITVFIGKVTQKNHNPVN